MDLIAASRSHGRNVAPALDEAVIAQVAAGCFAPEPERDTQALRSIRHFCWNLLPKVS
jgi:hypothetical protein